ncbi:hypothetical protein ACTU3I_14450 [Microbacterium sp. RD1]|uniref:hypothetical protein n=1 Tax=Microbacterium sp. RD1 TaxID=3457313 RepID=UPI003FA54B07
MPARASHARVAPTSPDAGAGVTGPESESPMLALLGDRLPCVQELPAVMTAERFARPEDVWGGHRAAVVGVDASDVHTRTDRRRRWRELADRSAALARRLRRLDHLMLLVDRLPEAAEARDDWDAAARRLHARLEWECGRSVVVTVVFVAGCDDYALLARRIAVRAQQAESLDAGIAVLWHEIVDSPIGVVAANDYV